MKDVQKAYSSNDVKVAQFGLVDGEIKRTGSIYLDWVFNGGIERGTITTIYGPSMSGKTTTALRMIAEIQRTGGTCALLRAEKGCNSEYMIKMGIDISKLIIIQDLPYGEAYFDAIYQCLNTVDFIVVDSLTALAAKGEVESTDDKQYMGLQARMISKGFRKIANLNNSSIVMFISQVREKPNSIGLPSMIPSGGQATIFYSDYLLECKLKCYFDDNGNEITHSTIKDPEKKADVNGALTYIYCRKNRRGTPQRTGKFYVYFKTGKVDELGEIIHIGTKLDVIDNTTSKGWITYNDNKYRLKEFAKILETDTELKQTILDLIYKKMY